MRLHRSALQFCVALCAIAPGSVFAADAPAVALLPAPESILEVKLSEVPGLSKTLELDANGFKELMRTAQLIPHEDADKVRKERSLALWCLGSFTTRQGTYGFTLWLGGPGFINAPDGRKGVFDFKLPKKPKDK